MAAFPDSDGPAPDPGNSPPEDWTADLSDEEQREIVDRLRRETGAETESGDA